MAHPTLVIGNRTYSSWSMRPWFALKVAGIAFDEVVIPLYEPGSKEKMAAASPTGKVPCLIDDGLTIWDSLAILDYLAERFPEARLWPADRAARARARAVSAEMHAGFQALRQALVMNVRKTFPPQPLSPEVEADVARIEALWAECRRDFGQQGPFLFGAFSIADAMYAPVVTRLRTYGVAVGPETRAYMDTILALPAMAEWDALAKAEPWVIERYEPAAPTA
ncbi:glutathione S-transferase [Rhodospirillum rubrum]|uniref:glutathione S-transferase family protein n=1 Tax=Rhodospirillum rubrum TaxID=1085 RepID=UPI001903C285|nr:glutathione S-transferase family protein [Rhodospirillum rubrum]MBK1663429.1 glutathione S-transferase [Rhodospirillum rubrum]MBK1675388.1 glutathione S-transferase [Rhodospirillum rubrum]